MKKTPTLPLAPDPIVMDRRALLLAACAGCMAACSPPPPPTDAGDSAPLPDATADDAPAEAACTPVDAASDAAACELPGVGNVCDFPVGTRRLLTPTIDGRMVAMIVARDAMGLYAMSARCR